MPAAAPPPPHATPQRICSAPHTYRACSPAPTTHHLLPAKPAGMPASAFAACSAVLQSAQVPSTWEGGLALAPLAFLKFNLVQGGGAFFGTHPWHCAAKDLQHSQQLPTGTERSKAH